MKKSLTHHVGFDRAPLVPIADFSRTGLSKQQLRDLWNIIGPTVDRNMRKGITLQDIFCVCYFQGLENATTAITTKGV